MVDRSTVIFGNQIKDATVTEDELSSSVAGNGISGGAGTALALDLNELSSVVVDVANDLIPIEDATDGSSKKESIVDLISAVAGIGLVASSGVLALDLNELSQVAVDVGADFVAIEDASDNSTKKESIADIMTAVAGVGLSASSGVLALDLNELSDVTIDVANDSIAILDATDGSSKRETVSALITAIAGVGLTDSSGVLALDLNELNTEATFDPNADFVTMVDATDSSSDKALWSVIATAIAGSGITATNGILSADSVTDNIVESDISQDNFSAITNGVLTDFDLTSIPLTASLQVYINGVYQEEGSGKDYELNPDSGDTKTIRINGDVLATGEKLIAHYIIDN